MPGLKSGGLSGVSLNRSRMGRQIPAQGTAARYRPKNCAFLLNLGRRGPAVQEFQGWVSCEADDDIERLNQLHSSGESRQSSRNS